VETQYVQQGDIFNFSGEVFKHDKLPAGVYTISQDMNGNLFLIRKRLNTDNLIKMPNSTADEINQIVDGFLTGEIKEAFERYGILYKRGILMYGPPGTGKTCIINQLVETAQAKDMVVLLGPQPQFVKTLVEKIRALEESNRAIMAVWEEFEDWVECNEAGILNLLDGIEQIDNVIYIATTNYIQRVPQRIRNRPSRFADVIEVGFPSAEVRHIFLKAKVHEDDNVDLDLWVEKTEGFTIDHLKDLIISVLVLKVPLDKAIDKLRNMGKEVGYGYDEDENGCDCPTCRRIADDPVAAPMIDFGAAKSPGSGW
jgi:AAA+ superfamily predicted ATPase